MAHQSSGRAGGIAGLAVVGIAALCCAQQFFASVVTSFGLAIASPAAALYLVAYFPDRISGDSLLASPVPWAPVVAVLAGWASTYRRVAGLRVVAVRATVLLAAAFLAALVVLVVTHPTAEEVQPRAGGGGLAATVVLCAVALLVNRRLPPRPGRSLVSRLVAMMSSSDRPAQEQTHHRPRKRRNRSRRTAQKAGPPPVGPPPSGGSARGGAPRGGGSRGGTPRGGAPFVGQPPRDGTPTGRRHQPPTGGRVADGTPTARPSGGGTPQWTDGTPRQRRAADADQVDGTPTRRRDR